MSPYPPKEAIVAEALGVVATPPIEVATGLSSRRVVTPHTTHHPTGSRRNQNTHERVADAEGRDRDRGWNTHIPLR